jgi:hypothetical protein
MDLIRTCEVGEECSTIDNVLKESDVLSPGESNSFC